MMQLPDTYIIYPRTALAPEQLVDYWSALANADTLKYRWSDMDKPTVARILERTANDELAYGVVDTMTRALVAEFALENFTGNAAQIHFSMHPDNASKVSLQLADQVTDTILENWTSMEDMGAAYLDTIFGMTPTKNRVACLFIRKAGFEKIGILENGINYLGDVDDALLTAKTRN